MKIKKIFALILAFIMLAVGIFVIIRTKNHSPDAKKLSCKLNIRCEVLMGNTSNPQKTAIIPSDGIIFSGKINFAEGENAFDILSTAIKQNKLHFDYDSTIYGAYIKAIGNIYNGDFGEQSCWLYTVGGKGQNVGCSGYEAKDGDVIEFVYSLDFGKDVGIEY